MKRNLAFWMLFVTVFLGFATSNANAAEGRFGLRGGLGTDVSGGVALGLGANYLLPTSGGAMELGIRIYGGSFDETTDNGFHQYKETTDVFVFATTVDYLIGHTPGRAGKFFIAGFGFGAIGIDWKESSPTDVSLGAPLPEGGSVQFADGSAGGTIFNLGVGATFDSPLDLRAEVPVIVTFGAPGEAGSVIPTLSLTAGYRF